MNSRPYEINDPDVQILVALSQSIKGEYVNPASDPWVGSPFEWILRIRSSRQRGKIGEQLIAGWAATRELNVVRSPNSESDRVIENKKVEVKFSTLWTNGQYVFQQIRDQDYDFLICLGLSPYSAQAWIVSKSQLLRDIIGNSSHSQHRGRQGSDTYWIAFKPNNPPEIFNDQPGTLAHVYETLHG